jgi:hypothetical protein
MRHVITKKKKTEAIKSMENGKKIEKEGGWPYKVS